MTFPQTPLDVSVEIDAGGWVDIKDGGYVFDRDGSGSIRLQRGRSGEAGQTERGTATMTLNNSDGRFSPRNPLSPYYGLIGRNTPVRVSVRQGDVFLDLPGAAADKATAPDASTLGITGDIDVRIDVSMSNWRAFADLAGKFVSTGNQRSWFLYVSGSGLVKLQWSADGSSTTLESSSTLPVPAYPGRLAIRATLDVNNGASGHTTTFYTSDSISGTWSQLGDPVVTSGTTSIFDSTADLELGSVASTSFDPMIGRIHAFELRSGIGGTVVANPDFTAQSTGATSFADTASSPNTWTVAGAASITNRHWRFHGEVSEWPVSWEASGNDVWTSVEASGILRRLSQGAAPLRSTLYSGMVGLSTNPPVAYWPMEDGPNATQFVSGLGGTPAAMLGSPELATSDLFDCSDSLPILGNGGAVGAVPVYTATGFSQVRFLLHLSSSGPTDGAIIARVSMTGSASRLDVRYNTSANGTITGLVYDSDGSLVHTSAFVSGLDDTLRQVTINFTQNGSDVDYAITPALVGASLAAGGGGTVTNSTFGRVSRVTINPTGNLDGVTVGHLSVHAQISGVFALSVPLKAYAGETAGRRIERLCAEQGITFRSIGDLDATEAMGAQRVATLLELVSQCADADLGILYEPREVLGLGYRTRESLYNQAARVALDYDAEHLAGPLDPIDDDQQIRNDVTVTREGGSSARVEVTDGPLSTQPPPDGVGLYDDAVTINIETDERLSDQASWRAHLGTVDEARYPSLQLNLASIAAETDLVSSLLDAEFGDRVTVDNPPAWLPPEQVSQVFYGYTESMRNYEHKMALVSTPALPYRVGVNGSAEFGHAESDGSTLAASIGTVSTVAFVADAETNNTTAGTSCVMSVPTGTRREDVMIALIGKIDQAAITPPAGWTLIGSQLAGSNVIYEAYYRVAYSEPANYTWSWGVNAKNVGWIGTYRNVDITTPIAASASSGTNVSGTTFDTPVTGSVPAGSRSVMGVFERHPASGAATTWTISSGTERMDAGSNAGSGQDDSSAVYDLSFATAGPLSVRTLTASQTVSQVALWTVVLAPATQMDISVSTASGPVWTYKGLSLPFPITIGGEVMEVDLIGDVLNTNPYFAVDVSDWSAQNATSVARSTAVVHPSGVASMLITPNGSSSSGGAQAGLTGAGTVTAGRSYIAAAWVNVPTGHSDIRTAIDWYDSAGAFLSSDLDGQFSAAADVWTRLTATLVAPASASQARLRIRLGSTPPSTALTYVWNAQLIDITDSNTSPQRFRVTRNVNGIVKSQSAGAAVTLFRPNYYAL